MTKEELENEVSRLRNRLAAIALNVAFIESTKALGGEMSEVLDAFDAIKRLALGLDGAATADTERAPAVPT